MKTILKLIQFELKQRFFTWLTLIFFIMLVFQAIWYTKGSFDYYVNDGILMNAPVIMYRNYSGLGMIMVIIVVIITGGVLYKDLQHKTAQWFYTFPVNEKQFYLGRFFAAFVYLFILSSGLTLGNFLSPYSGIGAPHRFGDMPILAILHATVIFLIPNLLLYISIIFTSVVYSRKVNVGYLAAFLLVVLFLIMQVSYESSGSSSPMYTYAEPTGYVAIQYYYEMVPTAMKNHGLIKLSSYLLANRLIWLTITGIIFFLGYRKFSFKHFVATPSKAKSGNELLDKSTASNAGKLISPNLSFKTPDFIKKLFTLSKLEFLNIVRPASFKIIVGILMFMVFMQNVLFNANYYIGNELPLTSNMTYFRLPWGVFIVMLLMIWSGELFFKEKTVKIWQITDALPVPTWVTQLSKFFALCGLAFVLCLSFVAIGIFTQLILGSADLINTKQYVIDVFGYRWGFINFVFEIALVFFVAGLTGNRFLTHIVSVGYFLFLIISFDMGLLEQVRYGFALTPGVEDFSEMSGYGILGSSANWFGLLWAILSVVFLLLGILFWQRGTPKKWFKKITEHQLSIPSKIVTVALLMGFFGLQFYLHKSIYANGNFKVAAVEDAEAADYEKMYRYLEEKNLPKYKTLDLTLDFYPDDRKVNYNAIIGLSKMPTDTLYLSFEDHISVEKIQMNNRPMKSVYNNNMHNVYGYLSDPTTLKDSLVMLTIKATKQYEGLSQGALQSDITNNGSYAAIKAYLPTIGYDSGRALKENRQRADNGLAKLDSRMAPINEALALTQLATTEDAEKVTGTIHISTPKVQTAVAPGILVSQEKKESRNHAIYRIGPSLFNWHIGSAEYNILADSIVGNTNYKIYAKPIHNCNIEIYKDAIAKALTYFNAALPNFDLKELRLYEKHHWSDTDFDAFANAIVISEKHGWVADTRHIEERSYVYQTVAAQIATLWIEENFDIANVQGANMLRIGLPEALALRFIEKELGKDAVQHIQKKKHEKYAKDRNNEPNVEPPILYDDGADYLAVNKGAIELYKVIEEVGPNTLIESMQSTASDGRYIVFKNVLEDLESKSGSKKVLQMLNKHSQ